MIFRPYLSVKKFCLVGFYQCRERGKFRFPEVVDRQISGMSWHSCYKNIVYKHKNAFLAFFSERLVEVILS